MAPKETENNAYAKFWGDKQRALWYVMVFSGVVNWYVTQRNLVSYPEFSQTLTLSKPYFLFVAVILT